MRLKLENLVHKGGKGVNQGEPEATTLSTNQQLLIPNRSDSLYAAAHLASIGNNNIAEKVNIILNE